MTGDPITYLSNAIQKIAAGRAASESGSHVAGIFGKAANAFEKEIRSYAAVLLRACGLDYDAEIRTAVKGPPFPKLTLGNCVAVITEASRLRPGRVSACVPGGWKLTTFVDTLKKINNGWVQVKHGDEVGQSALVTLMKSMLTILKLLNLQYPDLLKRRLSSS